MLVEGRVIGLLRGEKKGCAEYADACASILAGPVELVTVCVPTHKVCGCENLSVNDHDGPKGVPITPGKYTLHQSFTIAAHSDSVLVQARRRPSSPPTRRSTRCGSATTSRSTASRRTRSASR